MYRCVLVYKTQLIDDYISRSAERRSLRIPIDRDCLHWTPYVSSIMVEEAEQLACQEVGLRVNHRIRVRMGVRDVQQS